MARLALAATVLASLLGGAAAPAMAQAPCPAPAPVCRAAARVYPITAFDPVGSAVLIAPGRLVTNRHIVADRETATVFLPGGRRIEARIVPTTYPGDLILLDAPGLEAEAEIATAAARKGEEVYVAGADVGRGAVRVYAPGTVRLTPPADKPLARIHHAAPSQPGNSGGALLDPQGRLVGIVASGGDGRNEAIPATHIAALVRQSGPQHAEKSRSTGRAYARCAETLEATRPSQPGQRPPPAAARAAAEACGNAGNRQMLDLAGQALGKAGLLNESAAILERALAEDPNALNARIALVVTLHFERRYGEELPHLKRLIEVLPEDLEVLRLSLHAGKFSGDTAFAGRALGLLEKHHPNVAPAARRFYEAPLPGRRNP